MLWENRVAYILTTANNWSGPIGRFHLTVTTTSPEDLLLTCMDGLKQVTPTEWELVRERYRPTGELELLILTGKRYVP